MATRTSGWLVGLALAVALLAIAVPTQARNSDDGNGGDVIHCHTLADCLAQIPAPGGDGDLSGTDASDIGSVGDDPGPDLPPVDDESNQPPATTTADPPSPPKQADTSPAPATQPETTKAPGDTKTTTTTDQTPAAPQVAAPVVTKTEASPQPPPSPPPPPPKPKCLNHPEWADVPDGWQQAKDGNCFETPKVDLQLNGPSTLNASNGTVSFTIKIVNTGSNPTSGVLFKDQLEGNLVPTSMTASQGDRCVYDNDPRVRRIICSIGTIEGADPNTGTPHWATVSITLEVSGSGRETAMVEPGGEAETNTDNNSASAKITPVTVQTQRSVQQHGLQWGDHYYGSVQDFARVLVREGITWRGWKKTHKSLAQGLVAHDRKPSRR